MGFVMVIHDGSLAERGERVFELSDERSGCAQGRGVTLICHPSLNVVHSLRRAAAAMVVMGAADGLLSLPIMHLHDGLVTEDRKIVAEGSA